jgi:hypothetical protein
MSIKNWIWKSAIAGFAGSIVHLAFMYVKLRLGILPSFQPYPAFQATLSHWTGTDVPAIVPWLSPYTCVLPEHKPVRRGREMSG